MVTILSSPFFIETVLPFLLIFTVVFAILQKSGILGKDKKQIDALVGLVIGLIVISFARAVGIINNLLPFLAVSIVIILVFLILISMFSIREGEFKIPDSLKNVGIGLTALAVTIAVLIVTGAWDYILDRWFGGAGSEGFANFIFVVIVFIAITFIVLPKNSKE